MAKGIDVKTVKKAVLDIKELEAQIEYLNIQVKNKKEIVQKYLDENEVKSFEVTSNSDGRSYKVVKVEKVTIDYSLDRLKMNLPKDLFNEITVRSCVVMDYWKMIALQKKHGVDPTEFRKLCDVKKMVNKEAIKQLYAMGDITKEHLKGTYTAKVTKYFQIKEGKGE